MKALNKSEVKVRFKRVCGALWMLLASQEGKRKVREAFWTKRLSKLYSLTFMRERQNKFGDRLFKGNHEDKQWN